MTKVQLYVYDLSNGLAKAMSRALTGTQIDGIWHTSVVAWNREVFYGQGISECRPGGSHHGRPVEVVDCGETEIDEETFNEYIDSLRDHYTADAYHLLTFNCNSFTQDVIGFLTGGSIPPHISNLPTEFLNTPFGASLRPQIDAMFKRGPVGAASSSTSGESTSAPAQAQNVDLASTLLQAVAQQATASNGGGSANGNARSITATTSAPVSSGTNAISPAATTASSLLICTNLSSFQSTITTHPCLIALFTNPATCPPCRIIDPVFTNLAEIIGRGKRGKVGFVKVDMGAGEGGSVAGVYGVKVMPTFLFFKDGKKVDEMKGATTKELERKIDSFIDECFPPHPHQRLFLPATNSIPLHPILPVNKANFSALTTKLQSFLPAPTESGKDELRVKAALDTLNGEVIPKLLGTGGEKLDVVQVATIMEKWKVANVTLADRLQPEQAFPIIDLLAFGLAMPNVSAWTTIGIQTGSGDDVISTTLGPAVALSETTDRVGTKPTLLTTLRMLQMCCKDLSLARATFGTGSIIAPQARKVFLHCQLHEEAAVRNAAAGLAINIAAIRHRTRKEHEGKGSDAQGEEGGEVDEDWELEFLSAVMESVENAEDEDILYRLVAALALQLYLSPIHEDQRSFLDVMEVKRKLNAKLIQKIGGKALVSRAEVKKLLAEVADKMC